MKRKFYPLMVPLLAALLVSTPYAAQKIRTSEAARIALDAYIYGYPLVTMEMTKNIMTNVEKPNGKFAPIGQFANLRNFPAPSDKEVTAPNNDTLYSLAWVDLSNEPYILHVPDESGRYYLMPILSAWTDVIAAPGTRTTGTKAHDFALVGPNWKDPLPKNIIAFKSPTNLIWILGRTYSTGTPEDLKEVHQIQDHYTLTPLSNFGKSYTPPGGTVDANVDMSKPVRDQVNSMNGAEFYKMLAAAMKVNPPTKGDTAIIARMAKLGIIPGEEFDISKVDSNVADALNASVRAGQKKILARAKNTGMTRNGWTFSTQTGTYDSDYLQRAFVAAIGLGANKPQDAIYPFTAVDTAGVKLSGANRYVIHFAPGQMPPVRGFWSLTMYDPSFFFVPNDLNRYSLNMRDQLKTNEDGSMDLYVQHASPGADKESNWLPAPGGNFVLMFRFYWPEDAIISGKWNPPGVKRII